MGISPDVVIMTRAELDAIKQDEYARGHKRGVIEAQDKTSRTAKNCRNWIDGTCDRCGAQWQNCEVSPDFACPHFNPRR